MRLHEVPSRWISSHENRRHRAFGTALEAERRNNQLIFLHPLNEPLTTTRWSRGAWLLHKTIMGTPLGSAGARLSCGQNDYQETWFGEIELRVHLKHKFFLISIRTSRHILNRLKSSLPFFVRQTFPQLSTLVLAEVSLQPNRNLQHVSCSDGVFRCQTTNGRSTMASD